MALGFDSAPYVQSALRTGDDFQRSLVSGIETLGKQVRQDIQRIQATRELRAFGEEMVNVDPASPDFPQQLLGAAMRHPVALEDKRGIAAINMLGRQHEIAQRTRQRQMELNRPELRSVGSGGVASFTRDPSKPGGFGINVLVEPELPTKGAGLRSLGGGRWARELPDGKLAPVQVAGENPQRPALEKEASEISREISSMRTLAYQLDAAAQKAESDPERFGKEGTPERKAADAAAEVARKKSDEIARLVSERSKRLDEIKSALTSTPATLTQQEMQDAALLENPDATNQPLVDPAQQLPRLRRNKKTGKLEPY